jgi:U32 family peptidase
MNMNNNNVELLAPAGSFMSAYYAFEAGADAIYLGLESYSARQSAQNFNAVELGKIRRIGCERNKKIYIALNTVIKESELDSLFGTIIDLSHLGVDGLIVQDSGVVEVLRSHFPEIPIHASTQMALGNGRAVKAALSLGISRVILPRELPYERVCSLVRAFPEMEFEVFIHGALCYSYSGLCLASGLLADRSGNRGLCAQVCRLAFSRGDTVRNYCSCCDLFAGRDVGRLIEAGVKSLKIEGRQKPPEYVYNAVRLYRYIIDNPASGESDEYIRLLADSEFAFSREKTKGYLFGSAHEKIITATYPRSVGGSVGRVESTTSSTFSFTSDSSVSINDVLQFFLNKEESVPYKIPVRIMMQNGEKVALARPGAPITITCDKVPEIGQEIFKVYSKDLELPGIKHKDFGFYKRTIEADIALEIDPKPYCTIEARIGTLRLTYRHPCWFTCKEGFDNDRWLEQVFSEEDDTGYSIRIKRIRNETGMNPGTFCVSSKVLRRIKADFLFAVMKQEQELNAKRIAEILSEKTGTVEQPMYSDEIERFISKRANLNPAGGRIPFFTGGELSLERLTCVSDSCFIPMKPVVGDEDDSYYSAIESIVRAYPETIFYLGVNNLHQLIFLKELSSCKNVRSFVDFFFYLANSFSIRFVQEELDRAAFGYYWIEGDEQGYNTVKAKTSFPLLRLDGSFYPPYFFHTGSFRKESLGIRAVEEPVFEDELAWGDYRFILIEEKGTTYIFKEM